MKKTWLIPLALLLTLCLTACSANAIPQDALLPMDAQETGEIYFYGIVKSDNAYYARVLTTYKDAPDDKDYRYAPLADALHAAFQPEGTEGAWSPDEYHTAKDLAAADKAGKLPQGVLVNYDSTDGKIDRLEEHNPYKE